MCSGIPHGLQRHFFNNVEKLSVCFSVQYPYTFFGKVSIHIFRPLCKPFIPFWGWFMIEFGVFLICSWYKFFLRVGICKHLQSVACLFYSVTQNKVLQVWWCLVFSIAVWAFSLSQKPLPNPRTEHFCSVFFWKFNF